MVDQNTGNLLEAFRTQSNQKQISEPKALSSGQIVPQKSKRRKVRNAMIKIYVNGALILIASALVFVAYKLAVIPELFPPQVEANNKTKQQIPVKTEMKDYQGAANFAVFFAYYWLAGDIETAKNYTALNYIIPENAIKPVQQKVASSRVWNVNPIGKDKLNVVVQLTVQPKSSGNDDQQNQSDSTTKVVYLSVPLVMEDGRYGVYDIPTFVPTPKKASWVKEKVTTAPIHPDEQAKVRKYVELFLDEYFGGQSEKLSIYYKDGKPRPALANAKMNKIHQIVINQVAANTTNKVRVDVIADTVINNVEMQQRFQIYMVKDGQEWKIEKTNPTLPITKATQK